MMTFLQYVIESLIGESHHDSRKHDGESWWLCPFHADSDPSLHTLAHVPGQRDFWKCFGCDRWGDEAQFVRDCRDLLNLPECQGDYGDHQRLLYRLKVEYEGGVPDPRKDGSIRRLSPRELREQWGLFNLSLKGALSASQPTDEDLVGSSVQACRVWHELSRTEQEVILLAGHVFLREGVALTDLAVVGTYERLHEGQMNWGKWKPARKLPQAVAPRLEERERRGRLALVRR
jgi:hypothetical protein